MMQVPLVWGLVFKMQQQKLLLTNYSCPEFKTAYELYQNVRLQGEEFAEVYWREFGK